MELHDPSSSWLQARNGRLQDASPFTSGAALFRIGGSVPKFWLRYGFKGRVGLVHGNFLKSAFFTKLHQGRVNRNAGQPGCKPGPSIKILEMDESTQKAVLHCVFRVFTVWHDPASHTEDSFHMTFAKLSERGFFPTFGRCDQLHLTPRSKIANRCSITLRRKKCTRHYGEPPLSNRGCQFVAPLIFFPVHPLAHVRRTALQLHPIRLALS